MIRTGVRNISDTNQEGSVGARQVKYRSREINIINAGITIHGNTVRSKARLRRTPLERSKATLRRLRTGSLVTASARLDSNSPFAVCSGATHQAPRPLGLLGATSINGTFGQSGTKGQFRCPFRRLSARL